MFHQKEKSTRVKMHLFSSDKVKVWPKTNANRKQNIVMQQFHSMIFRKSLCWLSSLFLIFYPIELISTSTFTSLSGEFVKANAISNAEETKETLISYQDKIYPQVHLEKIPSNWIQTETEVGSNINDRRRLVVFKDPTSEAAIFVAYTPIRPDYPALSAFGNIDAVTNVVIPDGPGVKSEILYRKERKDRYEFEYIFQPLGQEARHLFTTWSMIPGDVLVTYTGQCLEENYQDSKELESILRSISDSFSVDIKRK